MKIERRIKTTLADKSTYEGQWHKDTNQKFGQGY
jgi:hypothetical protein